MPKDSSKDKEKGGGSSSEPKTVLDANTLQTELRAFASSLGFPAAAGGASGAGAAGAAASFEYDDFAPQKAAKKIAPAPKAERQQQQQRQQPGSSSGAAGAEGAHKGQQRKGQQQQQHGGSGDKQQQQQQQQKLTKQEKEAAAKEEAIRTRTWVDSVGPRPGEARGRSLLGKDEPSLWYEAAASLPTKVPSSNPGAGSISQQPKPLSEDATEALRSRAEALLEREGQLFEKEVAGRNAADARWLSQVRRSGTTADKVAAMSLMVGSSAAGGIKSLDGLLGLMAKSGGGKQVVLAAMEALQELFLSSLLPDRKLKVLEQQPLQALPPGKEGERCLLLWGVEDAVKSRYQQYLQLLEKCSTDNLDFVKERATKTIYRLLVAKPEGEQVLLCALVNKLGDPSRKLASDAAFLLGQLLLQHPVMKMVVVREVERFVFRPGLSERGRYYAVTFLNQIPMSHRPQEGGPALAHKLVDIYFSLFKLLLEGRLGTAAARQQQAEEHQQQHGGGGKKQQQQQQHGGKKGGGGRGGRGGGRGGGGRGGGGRYNSSHSKADGDGDDGGKAAAAAAAASVQQAGELDSRMLSALITGVRRAFPYVESDKVEPLVEGHGEALFKLVHTAPFTVALQALMLMYQLLAGRNAVSERYYRALYAVLLTEGARGASGVRGPQFLSLLVKSMKGDASIKRVAAFAKRLLQVSCHAPAPWAAGGLLLLSEVLKSHPGLWAAVQQPEDTGAAAAEVFRDAPEDSEGVGGGTRGAAAAAVGSDDDSDEEEVFKDVTDSEEDEEGAGGSKKKSKKQQKQQSKQQPKKQPQGSSKAAAAAAAGSTAGVGQQQWPKEGCYDMRKREPLYANAESSCWWELMVLSRHSHPSVAAFARSLLAGVPVVYSGDPLRDLGLTAFLDKFVNKKPKATAKGTSLMQPSHSLTASAAAGSSAAAAAAVAAGAAPADVTTLGSTAFADLAETEVSPDQLFFHKFFNLSAVKTKASTAAAARAAKAAAAAAKKAAGEGGDDSDSDGGELGQQGIESDEELESEEVEKALQAAEGVEDDGLGDPDVGYDYDDLLAAMAADDDDGGGSSSEGDEGDGDDGGSSGSGSEGGEEEEAEGVSASSGSGSGDDGSEESEEGGSEEGDWVMMEGAAAAQAAGGDDGGSSKKKKKRKHEAAAGAAGDDAADLEEVNPFDLASPSSSSDEDGEGEQQQQQQQGGSSRKKQKKDKQQQQQRQQDSGDAAEEADSDLDLDLDDIMGGSGDEDDADVDADDMMLSAEDEQDSDVEGEEQEAAAAAAAAGGSAGKGSKSKSSGGRKGRQKGAGLFADASAYDDFFAEFDKAAAAAAVAEQKGGGGDDEAAGAQRRGKRAGGRHKKHGGGGKRHKA